MKDLVHKAGRDKEFDISSGAVSSEEIGSDMHYGSKDILYKRAIPFSRHSAHKITVSEFDSCDLVIVMDKSNLRLLSRIVGEDRCYNSGKVHRLMEYVYDGSSIPDVADPWYTRDFEATYRDVSRGCAALLEIL